MTNPEEAQARGYKLQVTQPSMKRRSPWHDYRDQGTYMLTLVVSDRLPLFGALRGASEASPFSSSAPRVELTPLGEAIVQEEAQKISHHYPMIELWKLCVMPDHIHIILHVKDDLPPGKHLGHVVAGFKGGCSKAAMRLSASPSATLSSSAPSSAPASLRQCPEPLFPARSRRVPSKVRSLFEPGYNDKILLNDGQLSAWKAYLDDNPRRLLVKREHPEFFTIVHGMEIAGRRCQIVGNRFLLDIPDKVAVIVHRRYTEAENERLRREWLACGERGGVLVSAAIAPKEKEVIREAFNCGYRIVLLRESGFPKFYKPSGESFDACSRGLLLQVSPWEHHLQRLTITRAQCLELNAMAEALAAPSQPPL